MRLVFSRGFKMLLELLLVPVSARVRLLLLCFCCCCYREGAVIASSLCRLSLQGRAVGRVTADL